MDLFTPKCIVTTFIHVKYDYYFIYLFNFFILLFLDLFCN